MGKAVKAKKEEEKDAHDDSSASAAAAQQREQEGSLEAQIQMQRLLIDIDSSSYKHGFDPFPEGHICDRFLRLYLDTCDSSDAPTKRTGVEGQGLLPWLKLCPPWKISTPKLFTSPKTQQ